MSKISGKVIDYADDRPVLGVLVQGLGSIGAPFTSTTTDSNGNWTLDHDGLDDPYAKVSFNKEGYATETMRPQSASSATVVLARAGTLGSITLTLKRNPSKTLLFLAIGAVVAFLIFKYKNKIKL